jgi:hypothetical protein
MHLLPWLNFKEQALIVEKSTQYNQLIEAHISSLKTSGLHLNKIMQRVITLGLAGSLWNSMKIAEMIALPNYEDCVNSFFS